LLRGHVPRARSKSRSKTKRVSRRGASKKKAHHPGKYVNWLTLFSWSAITRAQAKVGWGYTDIIRELRRANFDFYQHLSVTTIREWVEEVGGFKQWKLSVLARATKGNIPGHNKGSRGGILVSKFVQFRIAAHEKFRHLTRSL
jgi:hypothetical protein